MSGRSIVKNKRTTAFLTRVLIILLIGSLLLTLASVFTFPAEGKRISDDYEKIRPVGPITVVELPIEPGVKPFPFPDPYPQPPDISPPVFNGIKYANVTNETLTLNWDAAYDSSPPITYNIYQATICGGQNFSAVTYITQNLSYQVPCSGGGITYYYVVRAEDSVGNEGNNTVECAYTKTLIDYIIYIKEEVIELGYNITISGDIYLPDIGKITVENLKIDADNNILTYGTISITELNVNGYIVNVSGTFDDKGVLLSGNLTLPGTVGGGVIGVEDLRISHDGKFNCAVYASSLNINDYVVNIEKGGFNNTGLIFSGSLTLPATVGGSTVAVENLDICSDGNFSGTVSITNLNVSGYIVNVDQVMFDNKGLVVSGSLTLPADVGGATVSVKDLKINSNGATIGSVSISSLNVGGYLISISVSGFQDGIVTVSGSFGLPTSVGGATVSVSSLTINSNGDYSGTVSITNLNVDGYTVNVVSVAFDNKGLIVDGSLTLPTSVGGATISVSNLAINSNGDYSGTVSVTNLDINGYMVNIDGVTFDNKGLMVTGSLTLPASVGGGTFSVKDLTINSNGDYSGSVSITSLNVSGYVINDLTVSFDSKGLIVDGSLTLPASVGGGTVSVSSLVISSNGDYSGTISITNLDINGYVVNVDGVTFDSKGLIVSGSLTLPASAGGATVSVKDLMINSNGDYSGCVSITNLNITGYIVNILTVSFDNKGLIVDGSLTLPASVGGATISVSNLAINSNGDYSGTVSISNLNINGYVVTMASVTFDNKGLIVSGSFTLPASVGGVTVSVSGLAINSNGDYSGTVSVTNLDINGYMVNIDGVTFDNKGLIISGSLTLSADVGGATISVKDLKINSTGTTIGSVSISSLNVGGYLISISVSGFQDGIVTVSGSFGLPTSVGSAAVTVKELQIDSKGITFSVIEIYADLDIKGVKVYVNTARITADGVIIDTASVTVPPITEINIGGGITVNNLVIKSNGDVDGSISGLSMEVAGFGFGVNNVKLINDGIYVESASFKLPEAYGVSATVTEFTFNSSGISFKSCSVTVPTFEVCGYTLSGMTASFEYTETGWKLYADATLGIPDWYGIEVNCIIESDGLKAFGLKVPGASIPIGSTPLILKDPGFWFDLSAYPPTVTCEFYGTIAPVVDSVLFNTVEADLTLRITTDGTIAGTSVTGIGVLTVIDYPVADASVTINNSGIYGDGNVNIATIITGKGYLAILYDGTITIHGEGSMQVLTYTFASAKFDLDNDHFVVNATIDLPINGTIAGINFDLSQRLDVGFGIYSATEITEAHADGHLNLESHFKIEPLVDYELSVNANLYINSSAITIWDNHLRLTWEYSSIIPDIKWSISDNPQAIDVLDSYWTDAYGTRINKAYLGDSVTAHLIFQGYDSGAPGIKAFGRPVNVRLVRDISNWGDAVVVEKDIDGWFIIGEPTEITIDLTVETTDVDWVGEWYDASYDRGYYTQSSWSGDWEFWGLFYWPEYEQDGYPPRLDIGIDDATGTWESSASGSPGSGGAEYTLLSEDFEGAWPGNWYIGDDDANSGEDYWGDNSYRTYAGSWGCYCADVGDTGVNHKYDNNMLAYILYPIDLTGYYSATLSYYFWLDSEMDFDYFFVDIYDTSWHELVSYCGYSDGWLYEQLDMSPYCGGTVWIGFFFSSDSSVTYEGAYIDNILITGWSDNTPPPTPTLSSPSNTATVDTITSTLTCNAVTDPDGDSVKYYFVVDDNSDFSSIVTEGYAGDAGDTSYIIGTDGDGYTLTNGVTYYWAVCAYDNTHFSGWSSIWSFTVSTTITEDIFYENFEGAWPGSWSLADTDGASGEDYWADNSYRAYTGFWSGWCADIGSKSSTNTDTIFYEDFEGVWPGNWLVGDSDTNSGSDYWGDNSYRAYTGSWSGYCADESDVSGQYYDNDMYAYMYRTVDVSSYDSATLTFYLWLDSESSYDYFDVIYYNPADSTWYSVYSKDGNTGGWVYVSIDIPTTATAVGFLFDSDSSVTYEGAYVDVVTFTATKILDTPNTETHTYDNNMYASMYRTVDLSGYDSAELQFYLWLDSEANYDYFYAGYYDSTDSAWHWSCSKTGNTGGWIYVSVNIPTTATAVGFLFDADSIVSSYEGAYIDEVILKATKTISAKSIDPGDSTVTIGHYMLESLCIKHNNLLLSAGEDNEEITQSNTYPICFS